MVVVPLSKPAIESSPTRCAEPTNLLRYAAAATLAASGALLVTGSRRAGLIAAASGTVLAMLDQKEVISSWWNTLPGFLDELHETLGRAQLAVEDLSLQGQKLRDVLRR